MGGGGGGGGGIRGPQGCGKAFNEGIVRGHALFFVWVWGLCLGFLVFLVLCFSFFFFGCVCLIWGGGGGGGGGWGGDLGLHLQQTLIPTRGGVFC